MAEMGGWATPKLATQRGPGPGLVLDIPRDGAADAVGEPDLRAPAELALDLRWVDGVAEVVARPVGHELDELVVAAATRPRRDAVELGADGAHHVDVALLAARADDVGLAHAPTRQHAGDGAAVVLDVDPVADV